MVKVKAYCKDYSKQDVQDAIKYLHAGHTKNIHLVAKKFGVKYGTLWNHYLGLNNAANWSQETRQYLTDAEEAILCDWIEHRSETGRPLSKRTLLQRVKKVIEKKPSSKWYQRFLKRHPRLWLRKPSGLDPK
jgi:hypothetical protein